MSSRASRVEGPARRALLARGRRRRSADSRRTAGASSRIAGRRVALAAYGFTGLAGLPALRPGRRRRSAVERMALLASRARARSSSRRARVSAHRGGRALARARARRERAAGRGAPRARAISTTQGLLHGPGGRDAHAQPRPRRAPAGRAALRGPTCCPRTAPRSSGAGRPHRAGDEQRALARRAGAIGLGFVRAEAAEPGRERARGGSAPRGIAALPLRSVGVSGALVVFAKQPLPGQVKTRLCPPFTAEQAADFYALHARRRARDDAARERRAGPRRRCSRSATARGGRPTLRCAGRPAPRAAAAAPISARAWSTRSRASCAAGRGPVLLRGSDSPTLRLATLVRRARSRSSAATS